MNIVLAGYVHLKFTSFETQINKYTEVFLTTGN